MEAKQIQAMFDRIAPVYDRLNDRLSLGMHRIWKQMAVSWSGAKPGDTALDVCCGSGDLTLKLAKQVGKTGRAIGIDFAAEQLAIAKARQAYYCPQLSIDWLQGDALDLPFDENYFDCATIGYGLRNVTDIRLCLKELHRVLKPAAKAAVLDFHLPSQGYMRAFQQWYIENIVVNVARDLGMESEYAYINPSIERFPTGTKQVEYAAKVGFTHATHYPLMGGMMGILVLVK